LKTLEEPPADSILILVTTEPQRLLETIISRCLRLNFAGETTFQRDEAFMRWLTGFSDRAGGEQRSLLNRYQLLSTLLNKLNEIKETITEVLTKKSPLERYEDLDPKMRDKLEDELTAAIEAEYRRQRADLLVGLQWWFRDVWLETLGLDSQRHAFPQLQTSSKAVACRITSRQAMDNLAQIEKSQRLLASNVQEALALEVGLLKLAL